MVVVTPRSRCCFFGLQGKEDRFQFFFFSFLFFSLKRIFICITATVDCSGWICGGTCRKSSLANPPRLACPNLKGQLKMNEQLWTFQHHMLKETRLITRPLGPACNFYTQRGGLFLLKGEQYINSRPLQIPQSLKVARNSFHLPQTSFRNYIPITVWFIVSVWNLPQA